MRHFIIGMLSAAPAIFLGGCVCAPVVTNDVVQLPCCGSVNDTQAVNISTGVGPWRVGPWRVRVPPGALPLQPVVAAGNQAWVAMSDPVWSPLVPASWVGPPGAPEDPGNYVYEVRFRAPPCQFARTITVSGKVAADNRATVFLGTDAPALASQPDNRGFWARNVTPFSITLIHASDTYVLTVLVHNDERPTGLALQAVAVSRCSL